MRSMFRSMLSTLALLVLLVGTARADGFKSYKVCGGDTFATCAAVSITVVGSDVSVRVWNLSGNSAATYGTNTYAGTVFNGIGFYNTGGATAVLGSLSMSGPVRSGDTPQSWKLRNTGTVAFNVDFNSIPRHGLTGQDGIASGCSTGQISTALDVYENPCTFDASDLNNWVTFSFKISGDWNPSASDIVLRGRNTMTGQATECFTGISPKGNSANCVTVTPEPVSMALLATGLAGMGGFNLRRRKKNIV